MFCFAGILQSLRKMCRKGVLFFIRDPSERTYNPVKDILDRPTTSQMRKLGISAFMYTIVAIFLFGAASWGLTLPPLNRLELVPLRTTSL
jgi:E3 ubiquitin-protein ligase MARCH6